MANPVSAANRWLKAAIDAGLAAAGYSSVKVYHDEADLDASYPLVTYHQAGAPVILRTGGGIAVVQPLYRVQVHARADATTITVLTAIADALDSGITSAAASTIGSFYISGAWVDPRGPIDERGIENSVVYLRRGAHYRVMLNPTS